MRRGLVFGKFMPLHRGHQLLIDRALAQTDDVTSVVYDSEPPGAYPPMPLEKRLGWLERLYPQAEAIVPVADPLRDEPDADDPRHAALYAETVRFLGRFDMVFTSEPSYEPFARELGARHVVVDGARQLVPISGTRIRENVFEHRGWMDPDVYATLIQKVVLVGTESTGKTTLARALAESFGTLWTHEYGRELWVEQGLQGTFTDFLKIALRQYQREQAGLRHANGFLFCDTNAWTTLHWSLRDSGTADARLHDLVDRTMGDYVWVLCANDFGWIDDGTREMRDGEAAEFQAGLERDLIRRGVEYTTVSGTIEQRIARVREVLAGVAGGEPAKRA